MNLRKSSLNLVKLLSLSVFRPTTASDPSNNASIQNPDVFGQTPLSTSANMSTRRAPVISISHGGGPMPILGDPGHKEISHSLRTKVPEILKLGTPDQPRAIVLVTAHWSERNPTISNGKKHNLYYDYYGFPPESYQLKYDAPGSPEVAKEIEKIFEEAGLKPETDEFRGWDHGVFVPLLLINPKANIPVIQLSVLESEDPAKHFAMGQALSKLRDSNIAIIGSGFASLHNLRLMFSGVTRTPAFKTKNEDWSRSVTDAALTDGVKEREEKFKGWRHWPGAYDMHPRGGAEHFLPLIVCAGAAGESKGAAYADDYQGLRMWSYYWE